MTKKKAIILIIVAVALVGIAVVVYNFVFNGSKSVGINSSITNEDGKNPKVDTKAQKILVVYFSETGNTQALAKIISDQVGGDFRRIETVKAYPSGNALYDYAKKERDDDARPELKDLGVNPEDYDVIFVGYPMWWYTLPMPMYTFFDAYDFSGKTIVPFNTHHGSGDGGTYETIKGFEPNATVLEGLPVEGNDMDKNQTSVVVNWLEKIGFSQK